jgi:hypothetical protein
MPADKPNKPAADRREVKAMAQGKGILLVTMEPPVAIEEEFNDWYDTEHIPERAGVRGFESALRFVCIDGWPRYLALYDLAYPDVLNEEDYGRVAGVNYSAWTRRMQGKVRGQYRAVGTQVYPGNALTGNAARLTLLRFSNVQANVERRIREALVVTFAARTETAQVRLFRVDGGGATDYIALIESQAAFAMSALDLTAFGSQRQHMDMVNTYVRHWPQRRTSDAAPR